MQVVGQNCARCGDRIESDLDARVCLTCKQPAHLQCNPKPPTDGAQAMAIVCGVCGGRRTLLGAKSPTPAPKPLLPATGHSERVALGLFVVGGILLLGLVIWAVVTPRPPTEAEREAALKYQQAEKEKNAAIKEEQQMFEELMKREGLEYSTRLGMTSQQKERLKQLEREHQKRIEAITGRK